MVVGDIKAHDEYHLSVDAVYRFRQRLCDVGKWLNFVALEKRCQLIPSCVARSFCQCREINRSRSFKGQPSRRITQELEKRGWISRLKNP